MELPPLDAPDAAEPSMVRVDGDEIWEVWCEVEDRALGMRPFQIAAAYKDERTAVAKARSIGRHAVVYRVRRRAVRWD